MIIGASPYTTDDLTQLVYVKTNIAGFFFDAVIQTDLSSTITITEHPVESGASITDHSYENAKQITMQIGMSDAATSLVDGQFEKGMTRSVNAFQVLMEMQRLRIPLQVTTRLGVWQNMLIESIAVPDDYTTLYGLKATVILREIFVAKVKTVKISARPQVTGQTNRGGVEPVEPNMSILKQLQEALGGLSSN
ncbi:hypothetical protein HMPREF0322_00396 [Desulfitobacterium hafniense DP7]|uniref:Dit-like phage tail protein N-terminal domain-containing protein n=1 Tax=Desulfitobacterium hafniense DP7 TaxID=537010 RepID=G9XHH1_DESHA|nr:hypothetical protein [Desulfitobacterium hafniense]EHL08973.1 hypothetical protein HMPREF0322_00396 [Desulfitobacterium hafniense DP7]